MTSIPDTGCTAEKARMPQREEEQEVTRAALMSDLFLYST
jgi:hypothetical protein